MLEDIDLDDLRFQELVSEARTRIVQRSPGWTEHNVSDPGITLIELFAWFTEMLGYRINRFSERLHLALLGLIGIRPAPARRASTHLRFMLEDDGCEVTIPRGTEVTAPRTDGQDPVVFQTTRELTIPAARLSACARVAGGAVRSVTVTDGRAAPAGDRSAGNGTLSAPGDALLLGFDHPVAGMVMRLEFEWAAEPAGAWTDSRLVWEASGKNSGWTAARVVGDETGGLSPAADVVLEVPEDADAVEVGGTERHWLRCRFDRRAPAGGQAEHVSAHITAISASVAGGTVAAAHVARAEQEAIGFSEGVPGVRYPLRHRPVLALEPGETLEVRESGDDGWIEWHAVASFAGHRSDERCFMLDEARGEVCFGPAIRQPDGGWRQLGAIPPKGSALRFTRYRHGGGEAGNVAPATLTALVSPIAGGVSVTNLEAGDGGADPEPLENARRRAAFEMRARSRAVTADDFERLAHEASPAVSRAICSARGVGAPIRLHVLPRVDPADRLLTSEELTPGADLMTALAEHLEDRRLIGTSIELLPVRLRGVCVAVDVQVAPLADVKRVEQDIAHALYVYLNPLIGGASNGPGAGWPAGRVLNSGELFGLVYGIAGVRLVNILRIYETDLLTGEQAPQPVEGRLVIDPDELIASGRHVVRARPVE